MRRAALRIVCGRCSRRRTRIARDARRIGSFNKLVGTNEKRQRYLTLELFRDFQVDEQLKLSRLLDRQVRRFSTLEDSFNVKRSPEIQVDVVRAIGNQGAFSCSCWKSEDGGEAMAVC